MQQAKPNFEEMERRLKADNRDFSAEKLKEAGISEFETFENYDLKKCVNKIIEYVKKWRIWDVSFCVNKVKIKEDDEGR